MTNLLEETLEAIRVENKKVSDIVEIGNVYGCVPLKKWKKIFDFDYNSGYGGEEISLDLYILFNDNTWLERAEYDGSEWWEYKKPPKSNKDIIITNVKS